MATEFKKEVLSAGRGAIPDYRKNTKVFFHFRTLRLQQDGSLDEDNLQDSVIDDSRAMGSDPFELLIGREFKLGVWEEVVKTMRVGEVARFRCPFMSIVEYPRVSKALRDLARKKAGKEVSPHTHGHQCAFSAMQGTGMKDLDSIIEDKCPLAFEFDLVRVEHPGEYKQDSWAMTESEKRTALPVLREEGKMLYEAGDYQQAAEKYFLALSYLEEMSIKEKPQCDEWNKIEGEKVPFLLNYAQCKLLLKDYAEVIRHTTMVLEFDDKNVKAFFRRARAHAASWNVEEAKADFAKAAQLDPSLSRIVEREVRSLLLRVKEKDADERERLKGKLF